MPIPPVLDGAGGRGAHLAILGQYTGFGSSHHKMRLEETQMHDGGRLFKLAVIGLV
jgi:hypothetical protein